MAQCRYGLYWRRFWNPYTHHIQGEVAHSFTCSLICGLLMTKPVTRTIWCPTVESLRISEWNEGSWRGVTLLYFRLCLEVLRKITKKLSRCSLFHAEIWTRRLLITKQKRQQVSRHVWTNSLVSDPCNVSPRHVGKSRDSRQKVREIA
jgi:hypothetical protein